MKTILCFLKQNIHLILNFHLFVIFFVSIDCNPVDPCGDSQINANFDYDHYQNITNLPIIFLNKTQGDVNGLSIEWNFGDGTTSSQQNTEHTYSSSGQYTVKITARNGCGKESSQEKLLSIQNPPQQKVLNMTRVAQQTMVWCWAAVSEMSLRYYNHPVAQCFMLSNWFQYDCCTFPTNCLTTGTLQQIQINLYSFGGLNSAIQNRVLTFREIVNEITNSRPIIIAYSNLQSGHVVVIFGYNQSNSNIYIYDPYYYNTQVPGGYFVVPYSSTFAYSGSLIWTNSIYRIGYN